MNSVNLVDMDFHSIKESLKEFMKKQTVFKDYNFEGSGLSALLDVLAYNSQNNAYLANMLANEAEIDSAVVRANVVSRAKLLGYTPRSITAARAVLSVSIVDPARQQDTLVIRANQIHGERRWSTIRLRDAEATHTEEARHEVHCR